MTANAYCIKYGCRTIDELRDWEHIATQAQAFEKPGTPNWNYCEELRLDLEWQRALFFKTESEWQVERDISAIELDTGVFGAYGRAYIAVMGMLDELDDIVPLHGRKLKIILISEPAR